MAIIWPGYYYNGMTAAVTNATVSVVLSGNLANDLVSLDPGATGLGFLGPDDRLYAISGMSYNSGTGQTTLTLGWAYKGATASGQPFSIVPIQGFAASASSKLNSLLGKIDPASVVLYFATTVALLAAYGAAAVVPGIVRTLGRTTAGDGGGAEFYYDSTDSVTADDGGMFRVDGQNRRWKIPNVTSVNPKWYGVLGDGSTDDSTQGNIAIAAAITARIPEVKFPKGLYILASSLVATASIRICGTGKPGPRIYSSPSLVYGGTELIFTKSTTDPALAASHAIQFNIGSDGAEGNANTELVDLTIAWTDKDSSGVYVIGADNIQIRNCWLTGGLLNDGAHTGFGISLHDVITSQIKGNEFYEMAYGINGYSLVNEDVIAENSFVNIKEVGILLRGKTSSTASVRIGPNNHTVGKYGVYISGPVNTVICDGGSYEDLGYASVKTSNTDYIDAAVTSFPKNVSVMNAVHIASGADTYCAASGATIQVVPNGGQISGNQLINPSANCVGLILANGSGADFVAVYGNRLDGTKPLFAPASVYTYVNRLDAPAQAIDVASTTSIDVSGVGTLFVNPSGTYNLTNLLNGQIGQIVTVWNQSAHAVTVKHDGTHFALAGSVDYVLTGAGYAIHLKCLDQTVWTPVGTRTP